MRIAGNLAYRIVDRAAYVAGYASGWFVFIMMALVVFEVFMRYVLKQPPMLADEFTAYLLVIVSYLGTAYTLKEGGHVRITFLTERISPRAGRRLRVVTLVLGLIFAIIMSIVSYNLLVFSMKLNMRSATWLRFPLKWPQLSLTVGFILLSLMMIATIVKRILDLKSGDSTSGGV